MASDQDPTLKILLIGPSSGGKTSLLLRYVDDIFDTETATATIGVDFRTKKVSVRGKPYRLLLFDTAGQERFQPLTSSYYRNAQGVIIVYDTSNRDSFLSMEDWFRQAETYASPGVVKCLVGSKTDKAASRAVKYEEGKELAERYGAMFVEVSSKTRENVRRPFVDVIDKIVETPELVNPQVKRRGTRENAVDVGGQPGADERITVCAC
ncbi:P-loop containing nucleoside triphosphate hydrolase protein [Terfezia claveryi]|nr:P-loop containing nucleoside triphosphate hydrolase protein [Terfezia claveryi]